MKRVLVLYGTTEGHTARIAEAIASELRREGLAADVIRAGAGDPTPADYEAMIVAASVHGGRYQKAVRRWVRARAVELIGKRTAFVSVSLAVLQDDPKVRAEVDAGVRRFLDETGWKPAEVKLLAGALPYTRYNWFKRWIMKRIVSRAHGDTDTSRDYDYTDWIEVRMFAARFGRQVAHAAAMKIPHPGKYPAAHFGVFG